MGSLQSGETLSDQSQKDRREHGLLANTMSLKMCTGWGCGWGQPPIKCVFVSIKVRASVVSRNRSL